MYSYYKFIYKATHKKTESLAIPLDSVKSTSNLARCEGKSRLAFGSRGRPVD